MNQSSVPERFYQRFDQSGRVLNPEWPVITTDESINLFPIREKGLRILFINAPIREWSYPNIMPIGQGYVASIARMDGHTIDVLDLNAERKGPVKDLPEVFIKRVESRIVQKLNEAKPDVIGLGGIITQYTWIKRIALLCKKVYPEVPIVLGGGISSCLPEFMVKYLPIDIAILEEGEATFSEVLHRIELKASFEGVKAVVWRKTLSSSDWTIQNNGLRSSFMSRAFGLDSLPWPLRSAFPED